LFVAHITLQYGKKNVPRNSSWSQCYCKVSNRIKLICKTSQVMASALKFLLKEAHQNNPSYHKSMANPWA
jgi:hypothetical protein